MITSNQDTKEVLIIEDDQGISEILKHICVELGLEVYQCYTGTDAIIAIQTRKFDLIITDLMLPGMAGEDLIKVFRSSQSSHHKTPIIVMSAKTDTQHKIDVLVIGASDYITKPFDIGEMKARICVQLRQLIYIDNGQTTKASNFESNDKILTNDSTVLMHKNLVLDPEGCAVTVNGIPISVTTKELQILELLLKNPNKLFTKENLFQSIWGETYIGTDNTINVHVSNLRQKITAVDSTETYIETIWGMGYKLKA